jgi:hypothetical protein
MTYSLSLRPRALAELAAAREHYAVVGHGDAFLDEADSVFEAIQRGRYAFRSSTARFTGPCYDATRLSCSSASGAKSSM